MVGNGVLKSSGFDDASNPSLLLITLTEYSNPVTAMLKLKFQKLSLFKIFKV